MVKTQTKNNVKIIMKEFTSIRNTIQTEVLTVFILYKEKYLQPYD